MEKLAFDFICEDTRYTVSIKHLKNGDYKGSFYYHDQGKKEEDSVNCEVFTRQDGSHFIYGKWIEGGEDIIFIAEVDEV